MAMPNSATKNSKAINSPETPQCEKDSKYAEQQQAAISASRPTWTQGAAAKSKGIDTKGG